MQYYVALLNEQATVCETVIISVLNSNWLVHLYTDTMSFPCLFLSRPTRFMHITIKT